jgi:serine/threonine protein kinase
VKIPPTLGRYEVVDLIGQGGMGALYRARDPRIGRYVAIKLLRPGYDTPELRDRFSREARAAGILSHPNIVTIYDVGEHDGLPFIAMEFVRGDTFADLVGLRPPLPVLRKVQLTEEVCAGLAHAHEMNIVHRDIKPANLIVGPEGTVKILDFGIAKLSATGNTLPGSILGSLNYMSPEQIRSAAVDARADIFSVGAVLYELLSHQPAFPGQLPDDVLPRILHGTPTPLLEYCPDLDPRLVEIVDKALEKDPDRRFQSILSLQKALAKVRLSPDFGKPMAADARKQRAEQIEQHLTDVERAFDGGEYEAAIESCKQILLLDSSDQRALDHLGRIHAAMDEQQAALEREAQRIREEEARRAEEERRRVEEERRRAEEERRRAEEERRRAEEERRRAEEEARAAAAAARLRDAEQKLDEASARLEQGDLDATADLLKRATELAPQHQSLTELSQRLQQARERRAAEEAAARLRQEVAALIRSARERLQSAGDSAADLAPALQAVNKALTLDADNAEAPELKAAIEAAIATRREAARARTVISNARTRFANGKHQAAIKLLEDYAPPPHPEIAEALNELRTALQQIEEQRRLERERIERQQRIATLLGEARTALAAQQFDQTLERLAAVEELDATTPDLAPLREQVAREQAAARLRAELDRTLANLDERLTRGELTEASELLTLAITLNATDPRVTTVRKRVEQAIAVREAAAARARAVEEKSAAAENALEQGDLDRARQLLTEAAGLDPQHQRTADLMPRVAEAIKQREAAEAAERLKKTIDEFMSAAEAQLRSPDRRAADVASALQKIGNVLALDPEHEGAKALKTTANEAMAELREAASIEAAIRNARSRFANGKHQSAIQLLEGLDPSKHPVVADTLKELREALHAIEERRRIEQEQAEQRRLAEEAAKALAPKDPDEELTRVFIPPGVAVEEQQAAGVQPWQWGVVIAMGIFIIALLAAIFVVLQV